MSERKICSPSASKDKRDKSPESSAEADSKKWEYITNNSSFMQSLISFMNESWLAVSQVRENCGLPASDKTAVIMTEEEREAKIKEILIKLQEKYKELSELEAQLGQISRTTSRERNFAQSSDQMQIPQGDVYRPLASSPPLQPSHTISGMPTYPQEQFGYASYYPTDGPEGGYQYPYMSGDMCQPMVPQRRKMQFSGSSSRAPALPPTYPGDAFQPYQDSESEYGETEGGNEGQYYTESGGATSASSAASVPEAQEYQDSSGISSAASSAPTSAVGPREGQLPQYQMQAAPMPRRSPHILSALPARSRLSQQFARFTQNYPVPAFRTMQYQARRPGLTSPPVQGDPQMQSLRSYVGDPCENSCNY